jgi:hypothetical protein
MTQDEKEQAIVDLLASRTLERMRKYDQDAVLDAATRRNLGASAAVMIAAQEHNQDFLDQLAFILKS